jgi:hypothetical protein
MKLKQLTIISSVLLLLILTTGAVWAAQPPDKTVVESDEIIRNDIALFGEDLEIQDGAEVHGDVALFGGNAVIAGTITGDIVLFGGNLTAANTAVIDGDCALLGGELIDETELGVNCTNVTFGPNFIPALPQFAASLDNSEISVSRPSAGSQFFSGLAEAAGQTLVMGLLAFGVASLLPNHLVQVEEVVRRKPMASGLVGLLTATAVPLLIALLAVTSAILVLVCVGILGFPIVFLLAVGLAGAMMLGWITMGDLVGRWLAEKFNLNNQNLPTTAVLGTVVLTLGIGLLSAIPFMIGEGFLAIIIGSVGLGAATLTRFGTRPYPLHAGYAAAGSAAVDPDKITSILETLPVEDTADLKEN